MCAPPPSSTSGSAPAAMHYFLLVQGSVCTTWPPYLSAQVCASEDSCMYLWYLLLPWPSCSYCSQLPEKPPYVLEYHLPINADINIDISSLVPRLLPDLSLNASPCMELAQTLMLVCIYIDSIKVWSWIFDLTAVTDIAKDVLLQFFSSLYILKNIKASSYILQWKYCLITLDHL